MEKFGNRYRIPTARLPAWNYGSAALYFITICTQNRIPYFGVVVQGAMQLSRIGEIAQSEWAKTFDLRPDMNLYQGAFVVMPNHFHAIIGIGPNAYNTNRQDCRDAMHGVSPEPLPAHDQDAMHGVSTTANPTMADATPPLPANQFGPQSKNLASIVRGFKSAVTIAARQTVPEFEWQSRFHDHIIRNETSFSRITDYIINNPGNWQEDTFFQEGI